MLLLKHIGSYSTPIKPILENQNFNISNLYSKICVETLMI
jgi:hypothetical protein